MEKFGQTIIVNGKVQYYANKKVKRHGIKENGEAKKIRKDKTSTKPTKTADR